MVDIARSEFILGGQKSGKSRRAEGLARDWLAADPAHQAVLIATAQAGDGEMRARIARHRAERAQRVPRCCQPILPMQIHPVTRQETSIFLPHWSKPNQACRVDFHSQPVMSAISHRPSLLG